LLATAAERQLAAAIAGDAIVVKSLFSIACVGT
jgi:hypothetical protein